MIRRAHPSEGERLREIAVAAKGHWGYEQERVTRWAAGLDLSPSRLRESEVWVVEADTHAVAWAAFAQRDDVVWLDDLWVDPAWIGRGAGSRLFRHVLERAGQLGAARVEWEAEPNAVGFYERMGGQHLRDSEPSEWGRVLPLLGIELAQRSR